ncbi:MAG: hypothetical protein JNK40_04435 [Chromatiales bacterium]|nr:hypothetical protein [Chromatiales bacterium]
MNKQLKKLAALSTLALIGTGAAQASVITPGTPGGSEVVATFVNGNGDSISLDLGKQLAGIVAGDSFALTSSITSFIAAAGGAANVSFALIAGEPGARTYLTSAGSETFNEEVQPGNNAKGLWSSTVTGLVTNLNQDDATATSANLAYGPYPSGSGTSNYLDGGYDTWQSGDFQFSNLAPGNASTYLFKVVFGLANIGLITPESLGLKVDISGSSLAVSSTTVVPAPAAVWLLGTALVPLARRAWLKSRTAA